MIKEFKARKVLRIFIFFVSIFLFSKLFFGKNSFFTIQSKNNEIEKINSAYQIIENEKKRLDFLLEQYNNENNLDFKEIIIRKELNYKGENESVYSY